MFIKTENGEKNLPHIWSVKHNQTHFYTTLILASALTIWMIALIPFYVSFVLCIIVLLPQLMLWWFWVGIEYNRLKVSQALNEKGDWYETYRMEAK